MHKGLELQEEVVGFFELLKVVYEGLQHIEPL